MSQTVIETQTGWMIKCPVCNWHEFPKEGRPGASWTFVNGDLVKPTFTPSMNSTLNDPNSPHHNPDVNWWRRCHFILTDGVLHFCGDCTHDYKGRSVPLEPWPDVEVRYHALTPERPS